MASILLVTNGDGIALAYKLVEEGHIVKVYGMESDVLSGLKNPSVVGDARKMIDQYDLILCGEPSHGLLADELKDKNKLVIGGGTFNDKMLLEPAYFDKVCTTLHIDNHLNDSADNIALYLEGWFNGKDWVLPFHYSDVYHRLMDGDHGPVTNCQGTMGWFAEETRIAGVALLPLTDLLEKVGYVGPITACCFVNNNNIAILSYNTCFTYDTFQGMCELIKSSVFDLLYGLASERFDRLPVNGINSYETEFAMSVRLTVPPYPYNIAFDEYEIETPISIPDEAKRHVWLCGIDHVLAVVTARGQNVRECQRRVYRTINNIVKSEEVQYRRDIGVHTEQVRIKLSEWGWI